jgi:hypothetical protein
MLNIVNAVKMIRVRMVRNKEWESRKKIVI